MTVLCGQGRVFGLAGFIYTREFIDHPSDIFQEGFCPVRYLMIPTPLQYLKALIFLIIEAWLISVAEQATVGKVNEARDSKHQSWALHRDRRAC